MILNVNVANNKRSLPCRWRRALPESSGSTATREPGAICKPAVSHPGSGRPHHDAMSTEQNVTKRIRGSRIIPPDIDTRRRTIPSAAKSRVQSRASAR